MQGDVYLSDAYSGREAAEAQNPGCLSTLPFSALSLILFIGILFWGLTRISFGFFTASAAPPPALTGRLASFFAPEVLRWEHEILAWAAENGLDPNLVATVMQIESCGDPQAVSRAGAMGLFQVMPYHFQDGEDTFDPHANAYRGLAYLKQAMESYPGSISLALAAYNGGIAGVSRPQSEWSQETVDYQHWGENIYADAAAGRENSPVLEEWLAAGGASLCAQAQQRLASFP
jgi:soluble lytic murein transglycosylase-like protein